MTQMFLENFPVSMRILSYAPQTKHPTTLHLSARDITSASWQRNLDLTHSLGTPHTISRIFCIWSARQWQIGPRFIWHRNKWRWARFAKHILDSIHACKSFFFRIYEINIFCLILIGFRTHETLVIHLKCTNPRFRLSTVMQDLDFSVTFVILDGIGYVV